MDEKRLDPNASRHKRSSLCKQTLFIGLFLLQFFAQNGQAQIPDSLDIRIAQMIMIGLPKAEIDTALLQDVRMGKVGAIILFEKNIPLTNSFAALKKIVWTYQQAAPTPLFIGIDQEGGKVNRLKVKYGFPRSITAAAMGKNKTLDSVRFYGESTAATLAGLGINVNFAPVVDVAVNPENPVIVKFERSFSAQEDTVAMMAKEFIKQHRKYGVVTVLKHFPGHGSSKDDTHFGIADVTKTWQERELRPYKTLLDSGYVDAIMTSHIVNKKLDKTGLPGTLSDKMIDSLLRRVLGYQGVVFSDDMQMNAIGKQYGLEESIKRCVNAGVDVLCFSNNFPTSEVRTVDKLHNIIRNFVERGEIKKGRIDEAYRRITALKAGLNSPDAVSYRKRAAAAELEINMLKQQNAQLRSGESEKMNQRLQEQIQSQRREIERLVRDQQRRGNQRAPEQRERPQPEPKKE